MKSLRGTEVLSPKDSEQSPKDSEQLNSANDVSELRVGSFPS